MNTGSGGAVSSLTSPQKRCFILKYGSGVIQRKKIDETLHYPCFIYPGGVALPVDSSATLSDWYTCHCFLYSYPMNPNDHRLLQQDSCNPALPRSSSTKFFHEAPLGLRYRCAATSVQNRFVVQGLCAKALSRCVPLAPQRAAAFIAIPQQP